MLILKLSTPQDILQSIAKRVKERRLERRYTQKKIAALSGIPLPTYRRFENTGEISLRSLIFIAIALDMEEDFSLIFATKTYSSIDDILKSKSKTPKRGKRNG